MRRLTTAVRQRPLAVALAAALFGCGAAPVQRPMMSGTPVVRAVQLAAGGEPVRWIARAQLCVPGVTVSTVQECAARRATPHADSLYRLVRALLPEPGEPVRGIACLRFSGMIPFGDSALVVVSTVSAAVTDNFAESRSRWVWIRSTTVGDSLWFGVGPGAATSDVAPFTSAERC